jgi:hypothetical protein
MGTSFGQTCWPEVGRLRWQLTTSQECHWWHQMGKLSSSASRPFHSMVDTTPILPGKSVGICARKRRTYIRLILIGQCEIATISRHFCRPFVVQNQSHTKEYHNTWHVNILMFLSQLSLSNGYTHSWVCLVCLSVCLWDGTFLNRWLDSSQTGVCCTSRQRKFCSFSRFYLF